MPLTQGVWAEREENARVRVAKSKENCFITVVLMTDLVT
jgi:hypothetical protein